MAFQARPASPVGVQPDSDMGHDMEYQMETDVPDTLEEYYKSKTMMVTSYW
ncbi:hypothetical protein DSO57_1009663 [Entomophthora muscae]|uniref:Uncharacterized protein n=1 Tax=Entomophthora muscae TaxID=34485 RepID=A0ACC2SVV6_9FUNG|nr:hypothetical protein DSO57_1009663 [Entomophthora muscae]